MHYPSHGTCIGTNVRTWAKTIQNRGRGCLCASPSSLLLLLAFHFHHSNYYHFPFSSATNKTTILKGAKVFWWEGGIAACYMLSLTYFFYSHLDTVAPENSLPTSTGAFWFPGIDSPATRKDLKRTQRIFEVSKSFSFHWETYTHKHKQV